MRIQNLKIATTAVVVILVCLIAIWNISRARSFQIFGELINRVETGEKIVALTFDDGPWNNGITDEVIAILKHHDVKATFFLNGLGIKDHPSATRRLVQSGHNLGNHSYSHNRLVFKGYDEIKEEVQSTSSLIRSSGFQGEIFFRAPYGKKLLVLPYYLKQQGITSVSWDVEPESYKNARRSADAMVEHVVSNTNPGSIILLHVLGSGNSTSRESLPLIIKALRAKGYRFVQLPELFQEKA
jgi:peptidoglycan/xylan/chitin deacetylase (PgdA/CDA1 family)